MLSCVSACVRFSAEVLGGKVGHGGFSYLPSNPSGGLSRGSLLSDWLTRTSTESEKLHMPERERKRESESGEKKVGHARSRDETQTPPEVCHGQMLEAASC